MKKKQSISFLLAILFLSSCAPKRVKINHYIEYDFFAEVTEVTHLNTEVDSLKGVIGGAVDGAERVYDRRRKKREIEDKGGLAIPDNSSSTFSAIIGAFVGGFKGLSRDLKKTYYKYQFSLRDVDSGTVRQFYSDSLLNRGDCVYVDVGGTSGKKRVDLKVVEKRVCDEITESEIVEDFD